MYKSITKSVIYHEIKSSIPTVFSYWTKEILLLGFFREQNSVSSLVILGSDEENSMGNSLLSLLISNYPALQ